MRLDDSVNLEVSRLAAVRTVFETFQVHKSADLNCMRHHSCDVIRENQPFTASFSALPALNVGTLAALIWIVAPV